MLLVMMYELILLYVIGVIVDLLELLDSLELQVLESLVMFWMDFLESLVMFWVHF